MRLAAVAKFHVWFAELAEPDGAHSAHVRLCWSYLHSLMLVVGFIKQLLRGLGTLIRGIQLYK